jgi:hypothetical protein
VSLGKRRERKAKPVSIFLAQQASMYEASKKVMQGSNHFDRTRWGIKLEEFNDNKGEQRRDNIIQNNAQIAIIPTLINEMNFKKCTSNKSIQKNWDELTVLNVPFDVADGLQKPKDKLLIRESEKKDDKWFKPWKLAAF